MEALFRRFRFPVVLALVVVALSAASFAGSTGFTGSIIVSQAGGGQDIVVDATLLVNNAGFNLNTLTCTAANCAYSLTFSITNTYLTTASLNDFGLQLFGDGSNASFDLSGGYTVPAGWTATAGAKINNGNGLGCNPSNGASGWLCGSATLMTNVLQIQHNGVGQMSFAGNFQQGTSIISAFDLMANGRTNANNSDTKWAISQGFDWTEFTPVPEPTALSMLGSGLLTAGVILRKRLQG